ncbi:MAG: HisA/HisF-related TIM barrel protein [Actinomycetota bacterium]
MTELYPAIDLLGGRCVRLHQGDYGQVTTYDVDPVEVAQGFVADGARWVHLVDLDAAKTGEPVNRDVIGRVAGAIEAKVQVGGGVRSVEAARELAALGVDRVVVGTVAVEDPELTRRIAETQPVALGLDVRGREVAVRGWTEGSGKDLLDVLASYAGAPGVEAVVVTQISVDGTLEGPDLRGLIEVLDAAPDGIDVVASGGVGELDHLVSIASVMAGDRRLAGAIVGKAIHDGRISVADAVAALE